MKKEMVPAILSGALVVGLATSAATPAYAAGVADAVVAAAPADGMLSGADAGAQVPEGVELKDVTQDSTSWDAGWYKVSDSVTISERVQVTGDVHLILGDGATLTAEEGISVAEGSSLTIYGQDGETAGKLVATATDGNAAIGGGSGSSAGTIVINGGVVGATAIAGVFEGRLC